MYLEVLWRESAEDHRGGFTEGIEGGMNGIQLRA